MALILNDVSEFMNQIRVIISFPSIMKGNVLDFALYYVNITSQ